MTRKHRRPYAGNCSPKWPAFLHLKRPPTWAQRALGAKNRLTAADAQSVEQSFEARLATLDEPGR